MHIRAAALAEVSRLSSKSTADACGRGILLVVALLAAACSSSRANEEGRPVPPSNVPTDPVAPPIVKAPPSVAARPVAGPASSTPPRVRRIEDLPTVTPLAVRPLRVDELPEAPSKGRRARREKDALTAGVALGAPSPKGSASPVQGALRIEDLPSASTAARPLRPDELNPELVRRAEELLWQSPAPIGTDVPLEVGGKAYVARFAVHYHEFGSAHKPWGYHKGVTLYTTAD